MIMFVKERRLLILVSIISLIGSAWAAEVPSIAFPATDSVTIHSDEAWEDTQPKIIHFKGHFRLEASDWSVSADQATLYGNLDDPETVTLTGSPARFQVAVVASGETEMVQGDADSITYQRSQNVIRLENSARLVWGENAIRGESIVYDFKSDRFRAAGDGGIHIEIPPWNEAGPE